MRIRRQSWLAKTMLGLTLAVVLAVAGCGDGKKTSDTTTPKPTPSVAKLPLVPAGNATISCTTHPYRGYGPSQPPSIDVIVPVRNSSDKNLDLVKDLESSDPHSYPVLIDANGNPVSRGNWQHTTGYDTKTLVPTESDNLEFGLDPADKYSQSSKDICTKLGIKLSSSRVHKDKKKGPAGLFFKEALYEDGVNGTATIPLTASSYDENSPANKDIRDIVQPNIGSSSYDVTTTPNRVAKIVCEPISDSSGVTPSITMVVSLTNNGPEDLNAPYDRNLAVPAKFLLDNNKIIEGNATSLDKNSKENSDFTFNNGVSDRVTFYFNDPGLARRVCEDLGIKTGAEGKASTTAARYVKAIILVLPGSDQPQIVNLDS